MRRQCQAPNICTPKWQSASRGTRVGLDGQAGEAGRPPHTGLHGELHCEMRFSCWCADVVHEARNPNAPGLSGILSMVLWNRTNSGNQFWNSVLDPKFGAAQMMEKDLLGGDVGLIVDLGRGSHVVGLCREAG